MDLKKGIQQMLDPLTSVQFIAIANPVQPTTAYIVKKTQIIVSRDSMDGLNPNLMEAGP
jgi:hypothetical protein